MPSTVEPCMVPAGLLILPPTVSYGQQHPHFKDGESEAEPGPLQVLAESIHVLPSEVHRPRVGVL